MCRCPAARSDRPASRSFGEEPTALLARAVQLRQQDKGAPHVDAVRALLLELDEGRRARRGADQSVRAAVASCYRSLRRCCSTSGSTVSPSSVRSCATCAKQPTSCPTCCRCLASLPRRRRQFALALRHFALSIPSARSGCRAEQPRADLSRSNAGCHDSMAGCVDARPTRIAAVRARTGCAKMPPSFAAEARGSSANTCSCRTLPPRSSTLRARQFKKALQPRAGATSSTSSARRCATNPSAISLRATPARSCAISSRSG